jgi:hypothetical protein
MSDETNKTQESELSNEQLENAAGGYFDEFESFRTLAPAAQESETGELSGELSAEEDGGTESEGRKAYDLNPNDLNVK